MTRMTIRHVLRRLSAGTVAVALTTVPIASAKAQVVGINSAIRNKVVVRAGGTAAPQPAVLKQKIALKDAVQTAEASQLQMLLLDGSVFTIGPNARLTIDRFVYDPSRNVKTVGASVARGAFRFMSGRALPGGGSSIQTPIATIGIRGTIIDGVVGVDAMRIAAGESAVGPGVGGDPQTASLIVLRGPGAGTQGGIRPGVIDVAAGGRSISLAQPSLAVYVPRAGAAPIGPFPISAVGMMSLSNLIVPPSALAVATMASATTSITPTQASQTAASSSRAAGLSLSRSATPWIGIGGLVAVLATVLVVTNDDNPDSR